MIRVQFQIKGKDKVFWVMIDDPEYFLTADQAQQFINDNKWLQKANARIVDVTIKVIQPIV